MPDALNEFIYANVPAYAGRARQRAVLNANDFVIERSDPDHRAFCAVKEERDRYVATLNLGRRLPCAGAGPKASGSTAGPRQGRRPGGRPGGSSPWERPVRDRLATLIPGLKRTP